MKIFICMTYWYRHNLDNFIACMRIKFNSKQLAVPACLCIRLSRGGMYYLPELVQSLEKYYRSKSIRLSCLKYFGAVPADFVFLFPFCSSLTVPKGLCSGGFPLHIQRNYKNIEKTFQYKPGPFLAYILEGPKPPQPLCCPTPPPPPH